MPNPPTKDKEGGIQINKTTTDTIVETMDMALTFFLTQGKCISIEKGLEKIKFHHLGLYCHHNTIHNWLHQYKF